MATDDTAGSSKTQEDKPSVLSTLPKELPLDFLRSITDSFSVERELSSDAFGKIYKGILPDGHVIAVRKLAENAPLPPDDVYNNEVSNILRTRHENIVNLVGYCHEGQKRVVQNNGGYIVADIVENLLCYEYLPNGSLRGSIFGHPDTSIGWSARFKIIKGICQGLLILHSIPIIHMDLKPENIWLDENLVPKIANFGLSIFLGQDQDVIHREVVVGSIGYIAPEYLYRGRISAQVDVYSLGILIIEITTGEENIVDLNQPSARAYINKISKDWTEEHIASRYSSFDADCLQEVNACIKIGLECVEVDPTNRPSIEKVVDKLYARSGS